MLLWLGARFALAEGKWPSLSVLDRRICSLFFYWSTWNVFLGAMLVCAHPAWHNPAVQDLKLVSPSTGRKKLGAIFRCQHAPALDISPHEAKWMRDVERVVLWGCREGAPSRSWAWC